MRSIILVLLLSSFSFCAEVDIHKLFEIFSGLTKDEATKLDEIMLHSTDYNGRIDQVKYKKPSKENKLRAKVNSRAAYEFVEGALQYGRRIRRGEMNMKMMDGIRKVVLSSPPHRLSPYGYMFTSRLKEHWFRLPLN
ncbi:hypothetical protein OSTOST_22352, partial [Ostertagia ostertagi]